MKAGSVLSFVFGLLGTLLCIAVVVVVWVVSSRTIDATTEAFEIVDTTLTNVHERIENTSDKVEDLKITAEDVNEGIKKWTVQTAASAANDKFALEEKGEKLSTGLNKVDHVLEVSESKLNLIDKAMKVGGKLGVNNENERAAELAKNIGAAREQIADCTEVVDKITTGLASAEEMTEERSGKIVKLSAQAVLTLTATDERIDALNAKVTELQMKCSQAEKSTLKVIRLVTAVLIFLAVWMGAGQISLLLRGWRAMRA